MVIERGRKIVFGASKVEILKDSTYMNGVFLFVDCNKLGYPRCIRNRKAESYMNEFFNLIFNLRNLRGVESSLLFF